jgi:thiol-disulfide isomerase/thioredoxin
MTASATPSRFRPRYVLAAAGAAALALAAVYGIAGDWRNPAGGAICTEAKAAGKRLAPFTRGEVAAVTVPSDARPIPNVNFVGADGQAKSLADWRGRTILLNLWATWCVPCRKEMPALDELQAKLGAQNFEVVAVNIDTRDPEKPKNWLRESKIEKLGYYTDSSAKIFQDLKAAGKAFGMPTTVLIDPSGCEIASLAGPAEWASEDALKLIRAALGN